VDNINTSIKHHTGLIILIAIAFSFIFPSTGALLKPYLNPLLIALMFLSCLDLNVVEIIRSLNDFKNISLMLLIVHLISPLIVYFLRDYFSPPVYLGLIISATIPAGRSAVFLSNIYGGVPIKALVSTSISNFFSPILVPGFVWIFAHTIIRMDILDMSRTIIYLVAIPLILGVIFGKTSYGKKLNNYSSSISILILFFIILGIISPLKNIVIDNLQLSLILGILISVLIIIDFCLGYFLGKNHSENVTYAISSSYKNYTLGTLLALAVFSPIVALPSVVYTVVSNILLIPLQWFLEPRRPLPPTVRHQRRNLLLLVLSIIITIALAISPILNSIVYNISKYPIFASVFSGVLFTSTFTVATGSLLLIKLSQTIHPLVLILFAGLGAALFDFLIFSLIKQHVSSHVSPIYKRLIRLSHLHKISHTHYFAWSIPVLGAVIMASPLPDELAVSLLGVSKLSGRKFLTLALSSHIIGMTLLMIGSSLL
jgi:BASS family bile acid:Na+ symporter